MFITCELPDGTILNRPVFLIKKCAANGMEVTENDLYVFQMNCVICIDEHGRVYQSWNLFLKNNIFPRCKMYCPINGQYRAEIIGNEDNPDEAQVKIRSDCFISPFFGLR